MDQFEQLKGTAFNDTFSEQKNKRESERKKHLKTKWPLSID